MADSKVVVLHGTCYTTFYSPVSWNSSSCTFVAGVLVSEMLDSEGDLSDSDSNSDSERSQSDTDD